MAFSLGRDDTLIVADAQNGGPSGLATAAAAAAAPGLVAGSMSIVTELRPRLQPRSVARLVLSSHRTFERVHARAEARARLSGYAGEGLSLSEAVLFSSQYRAHLSQCVQDMEREAEVEEFRAREKAAADAQRAATGAAVAAPAVAREPVAHRVEYWRRCLELWHWCEVFFLGDATAAAASASASASASAGALHDGSGGGGGSGSGVVSHLVVEWLLTHYRVEMEGTPLYLADDAARARALGDGSQWPVPGTVVVTEQSALVEIAELAGGGGGGGGGRGVGRRTRGGIARAQGAESCRHFWPLLSRFMSRLDVGEARQLLRMHSLFPHALAGAPGSGSASDRSRNLPRLSAESLLLRCDAVIAAAPSATVISAANSSSSVGVGDDLASFQARRLRWRAEVSSLLQDVETFAGTGAISGAGVGVGSLTQSSALRPLSGLCNLLLGNGRATGEACWRWYHNVCASLLYGHPDATRGVPSPAEGSDGGGNSRGSFSVASLLEKSITAHDAFLCAGAAADELGFGYLAVLRNAVELDALVAVQDADALLGAHTPWLPAHLSDLLSLAAAHCANAPSAAAAAALSSSSSSSSTMMTEGEEGAGAARSSSASLAAEAALTSLGMGGGFDSFVVESLGVSLREHYLRSYANAIGSAHVFDVMAVRFPTPKQQQQQQQQQPGQPRQPGQQQQRSGGEAIGFWQQAVSYLLRCPGELLSGAPRVRAITAAAAASSSSSPSSERTCRRALAVASRAQAAVEAARLRLRLARGGGELEREGEDGGNTSQRNQSASAAAAAAAAAAGDDDGSFGLGPGAGAAFPALLALSSEADAAGPGEGSLRALPHAAALLQRRADAAAFASNLAATATARARALASTGRHGDAVRWLILGGGGDGGACSSSGSDVKDQRGGAKLCSDTLRSLLSSAVESAMKTTALDAHGKPSFPQLDSIAAAAAASPTAPVALGGGLRIGGGAGDGAGDDDDDDDDICVLGVGGGANGESSRAFTCASRGLVYAMRYRELRRAIASANSCAKALSSSSSSSSAKVWTEHERAVACEDLARRRRWCCEAAISLLVDDIEAEGSKDVDTMTTAMMGGHREGATARGERDWSWSWQLHESAKASPPSPSALTSPGALLPSRGLAPRHAWTHIISAALAPLLVPGRAALTGEATAAAAARSEAMSAEQKGSSSSAQPVSSASTAPLAPATVPFLIGDGVPGRSSGGGPGPGPGAQPSLPATVAMEMLACLEEVRDFDELHLGSEKSAERRGDALSAALALFIGRAVLW